MVVPASFYSRTTVTMMIDEDDIGVGTLTISELGMKWESDEVPPISIEKQDIVKFMLAYMPEIHIDMLAMCNFGSPSYIGHLDLDEGEKDMFELKLIPVDQEDIVEIEKALKKLVGINPGPMESQSDDSTSEDEEEMEPE